MRDLLPAIFGLVGVVVGSVLTGSVTWRIERRKAAWLATSFARAVSEELISCGVTAKLDRKSKKHSGLFNREFFAVPSWYESRTVLSQIGLEGPEEYQTVTRAILSIELLRQSAPDEEWSEGLDNELAELVDEIDAALDALSPLLRGDYVHRWKARARHLLWRLRLRTWA
jgi:hypothetical protein